MASVKASGKTEVYTLKPEERAVFKAAMVPVHDKMADRIGKETIADQFTKLLAFKK